MTCISIVQGRLSESVADFYQHFPITNWRNEFSMAAEMGFDGIEWIITDFSNPIFDPITQAEIQSIISKSGVKISSISLDLFAKQNLGNFSQLQIAWVFERILHFAAETDIGRISVPVEELSGIRDSKSLETVSTQLIEIMNFDFPKHCSLVIETDLSPLNLNFFLDNPGLTDLGLVLDIGNIAANGFSLNQYVKLHSNRVFGLHIKDRGIGFGTSIPLGSGDAEFSVLNNNLDNLIALKDITLQSYRTTSSFAKDAKNAKLFLEKSLSKLNR